MIESLTLQNFKSHRCTKFNFDSSRLHAIVGQNGSGKTSTLQALWSLGDIFVKAGDIPFHSSWQSQIADRQIVDEAEARVRAAVRVRAVARAVATAGAAERAAARDAERAAAKDAERAKAKALINQRLFSTKLVEFFTTLQKQETTVTGIYSNTEDSTDSLKKWHFGYKGKDEVTGFLKSGDQIDKKTWLEMITSTIPLKLIASNLAQPSYSEQIAPVLKANGENLASALDYLRDEDPDRFDRLQAMLRQVVPIVKGISLRRAQLDIDHQRTIEIDGKSIAYTDSQPVMGKEVVFNMATGDRLPASVVSEGTVLTLGILSILMSPQQPKIILLDDVEQGLHPKAQRELMQVFKEIIKAHPDLQIIFTTHSPYIIDALEPSQVHVLGTGTDGFTHTKRLDEHPDAEWAKQTLTTGEFWDAEGEDWVMSGEVHD
jgi:predicted ATPase